jgi:hypothetical protein
MQRRVKQTRRQREKGKEKLPTGTCQGVESEKSDMVHQADIYVHKPASPERKDGLPACVHVNVFLHHHRHRHMLCSRVHRQHVGHSSRNARLRQHGGRHAIPGGAQRQQADSGVAAAGGIEGLEDDRVLLTSDEA